jgi:hypothetical protein
MKEAKVMKQEVVHQVRNVLFAAILFGLVPAAYGSTLYAASNGVDGAGCGPTATPCRSITRAIANAAPGDTIQVRPGLYGDLNGNGVLGETGEETPSPGCDCMLSVNKTVILISTDGAAATVINATTVSAGKNVLIIANDVEFGRPDHGFFVTNTNPTNGGGIVIDGTDVKVRGNHFLRTNGDFSGFGIDTVNNASEIVLIEGNQSVGWNSGIHVLDSGKTVSKNHVSFNSVGIAAGGGSLVGNVAINNFEGIFVTGSATAVGNAAYGNTHGIFAGAAAAGVIQKNNIFGNISCGLENSGAPGLVATNNYWGAATGPGPNPADTVCNIGAGTTTTTPFATTRFAINPSFEP